MFERRLRILLGVLGVALAILLVRLGQLQIVQADHFREQAARSLILRPTTLPFVRGRILDRSGNTLVGDVPAWNLTVDHSIIAADVGGDVAALKSRVRRLQRAGRYGKGLSDTQVEQALRDELATMWRDLAHFASNRAPVTVSTLKRRATDVYRHVARIRAAVARRRGFDAPVAEEGRAHTIVAGLDAAEQIRAREYFARYLWVHVQPASVRRFARDAAPFAHVLGRLGRVDAAHVADDPAADDPFARYKANELVGVSGVELAAEQLMRGRRGQVTVDRGGQIIAADTIDVQNGADVNVTLQSALQRRLYHLLAGVVEGRSTSSGGAIVVLEVQSRELLALVSYPSYDPNRFGELYPRLNKDTDHLPLRFRAVANRYAPGSIVKPLVCLSGLISGLITQDSREECTGYLFPEKRDAWRCWQIHGTNRRKAHGPVNVVEALTGSCNVFMYRLGERIGVDGLCSTFDMVGIGKNTGTGLREEAPGINPTPGWLMFHKNIRATPGMARLFAIGQGELSMTPVQVANLMATYASGRFRPVTLFRQEELTPEWTLPATPDQWSLIRRGIYGVVNDPEGTAYKYAHFVDDRFALCGKTGSATAHPWPTAYRVPYVDASGAEQVEVVPGGAQGEALRRFTADHPKATFDLQKVEVASRWPPHPEPSGGRYSHAWFGGYLQEKQADGSPDWSREPRIAFAILVEFGGSGGQIAGPMARRVASTLLEAFGPDLERLDTPAEGTTP